MHFFPFGPQQFSPFFGATGGFPGFGGSPFGPFNTPWNSQFNPFGGFNNGASNFGAFSPVGNWWNNGFNSFSGGSNPGAGQFNNGSWISNFGGWNQPAFWNNWTGSVPFAFPFNWGFSPVNTDNSNGENNQQNFPFGFAGFTPFGFVNPNQTQAA